MNRDLPLPNRTPDKPIRVEHQIPDKKEEPKPEIINKVHVPEQPAPVVNVTVPEQAAPIVNVSPSEVSNEGQRASRNDGSKLGKILWPVAAGAGLVGGTAGTTYYMTKPTPEPPAVIEETQVVVEPTKSLLQKLQDTGKHLPPRKK